MIQNYADLLWSNFIASSNNNNNNNNNDIKENFHNQITNIDINNNDNNNKLFDKYCQNGVNYFSDYIKSLHSNLNLKNFTIVIAAEDIDNNNSNNNIHKNKIMDRILSFIKFSTYNKNKQSKQIVNKINNNNNKLNNNSRISMYLKTREIINRFENFIFIVIVIIVVI